jgi:hypothetical protein
MSTETKRKSAFVGLFILVAVVSIAVTAFISQKTTATSFVGAQRGMIHRAYVTYNDSDTITIEPGYGECSLSYWEITSPIDHNMTSLASGEDWHYIYIDDVNSVYPTPTIKDCTTEPTWSDSKLGWYNGYDRCIGVVWSPSGSSTMTEFKANSGLKCILADAISLLSNGNPTGSWETLESTAYMPVNIIAAQCYIAGADWNSKLTIYLDADGLQGRGLADCSYANYACSVGWIDIPKGHSRDLDWCGEDDDDNQFTVRIIGYQIDR